MIRALAAFLAVCGTALCAQGITDTCGRVEAMEGAVSISRGGDRIVAAPQPDKTILVCYENRFNKSSKSGDWSLNVSGAMVAGSLSVNGPDGAEGFTVIAPTGYMIWPADLSDTHVPDGQAVEVLLIQGMM